MSRAAAGSRIVDDEPVRGILVDTADVVDPDGTVRPAVALTLICDTGRDHARRYVFDLEMLHNLEVLLPDLVVEAREELDGRRARAR